MRPPHPRRPAGDHGGSPVGRTSDSLAGQDGHTRPRCGVLDERSENALFDLGVLGRVHDAVSHINQRLKIILGCLGPGESFHPVEGFAQPDRPDFHGNTGAFEVQEADQ